MSSSALLAGLAEIGDVLGIDVLNPLTSDWHIVANGSSALVINPDTVSRFEYRGETRISDYPVEQGAFASYNRVLTPFDIRMTMVCSGLLLDKARGALGIGAISGALGLGSSQPMQKSDFIDTLESMRETTNLFDIVTPDRVYESLSLTHYDYRRETTNGATMLIVEAWFQEIRVTGSASYTSSNSPSAATPVSNGSVQTFPYGSNPTTALLGVL